jgi:hypothetical protein
MGKQKCQSCGDIIDSGLILSPYCNCNPNRAKETLLTPDMRDEIRKQVSKDVPKYLWRWIGGVTLITLLGLWQAFTNIVNWGEKIVKDRVSKEFEQPSISEIVRGVAATKAEDLLLKQINPEVDKFKNKTEESIAETKQLIMSAQSKLNDWTMMLDFEVSARYGSRHSYSIILALADRPDSIGETAKHCAEIILKELLILRNVPEAYFGLEFTRSDGEKVSAEKLSTTELFMYLESPAFPKEHLPSIMAHIAKKPKKEVCLEAKRILQFSDSLPACAATCGILNKVLGNKAQFLAFDDWIKACEEELTK